MQTPATLKFFPNHIQILLILPKFHKFMFVTIVTNSWLTLSLNFVYPEIRLKATWHTQADKAQSTNGVKRQRRHQAVLGDSSQ